MPPVLVGEGYSEELSCAVCLDSWKDPEELLPCGHIFCKGCSQTLTLCPTCRETIQSRKTPNRTLINMALQVEVRCMSCGWRGSRESSARHTCDSSTGPQPATQVPPPTSNLQSFNLDALWAAPSNSEHQWTSLGPSAPSPASSNPAQPSVAAQPSNYMESHLPETRRNTQGRNSPGTVAGSPSSYPPYLQPVHQQTTMVAPPQQPQHQPKPKFSQYPIQYQQQQSLTPSQAHTHAPPGAGYAHYSNPSLMVPNQMPQGAAPPVSGSPGYYTGGSTQAYSYGVPQQAQQQQQQQQYRPSPPRPTSAVSQPPPQRAVSSVIEPHGPRPWALYDLSQEEYDQIVSLFVYFDEDESGKLDKREVARLAQWLNFARTPAEVDRMFNVMDVNHSGSLSVGEFLTWLRHNRPNPKALYGLSQAQYNTIMMQFRTYDTNQDGFICMKEFTDMVMNLKDVSDEETAHNLFQMVDTNRDGYINLHEFLLFRAGR